MMFDVCFSADGRKFTVLISFDNRPLAESVLKACAGHLGSIEKTRYWQIHERRDSEPLRSPIDL